MVFSKSGRGGSGTSNGLHVGQSKFPQRVPGPGAGNGRGASHGRGREKWALGNFAEYPSREEVVTFIGEKVGGSGGRFPRELQGVYERRTSRYTGRTHHPPSNRLIVISRSYVIKQIKRLVEKYIYIYKRE